jgi:hypothetical protein
MEKSSSKRQEVVNKFRMKMMAKASRPSGYVDKDLNKAKLAFESAMREKIQGTNTNSDAPPSTNHDHGNPNVKFAPSKDVDSTKNIMFASGNNTDSTTPAVLTDSSFGTSADTSILTTPAVTTDSSFGTVVDTSIQMSEHTVDDEYNPNNFVFGPTFPAAKPADEQESREEAAIGLASLFGQPATAEKGEEEEAAARDEDSAL